MDRVWVFDLDATLIETGPLYGQAELAFAQLIMKALPRPHRPLAVLQLVDEIDLKLVERWGGSRDRFPASLCHCYRQLCERVGITPDERVERDVWWWGESAFDPDKYGPDLLIPDVEKVLDFLTCAKSDTLLVLTAGDPAVQGAKWEGCGLRRWFSEDRLIIVRWEPAAGYPGDKTEELVALRGRYPGRKIFMVGDSISSDIVPAIGAGIKAIHIPSNWGWRPDEQKLPKGAVVLERIVQIRDRYDEL
jgi:putative hydrolase of the HAD superfamily